MTQPPLAGNPQSNRDILIQQKNKIVRGIKIAKNAPSISHLFFGDDSFLFCNALLENVRVVQSILEEHCEMYGQMINFHKSVRALAKND